MGLDRHVVLAVSYGRSLLAWQTGGRARPFSATIAVTNRCNLDCSYCNTPQLDPTDPTLEQVATILERLQSVGVKRLGLTGGEPLVRKDIGEVVTLAKGRGFYVTMNTNLALYGRRKAQASDVDMFFTSVDGSRESHEATRGAGTYDCVVEAITAIVAEGRPVTAICVVTEHSIDRAEVLLNVAEHTGFRVHFQPQCTDTDIVRGEASLSDERQRRFWQRLVARKRAGAPIASSVPYLEALAQWDAFQPTARFDPEVRCAASRGFMYIDPQGAAYPCAYTKGKTAAVDFLSHDWRDAIGRETPCTRCSVGPYLEFNLLYQRPVRTALSLARSYLRL